MAYYFYPSGQTLASVPSVQGIPSMRPPTMSNKNDMSKIIDPKGDRGGLYIGNISCTQNPMLLKMFKIGAVVTIDSDNTSIRFDNGIIKEHFIMPVVQSTPVNAIIKYLHPTVDFISKAIKDSNVLVHCHSGMRLSSAVAIGYLMKNHGLSIQKAFVHVKHCRSVAKIQKQLLTKLKEYQSQCRFPKEAYLPKVEESPENSTFTTDSDDSIKQNLPFDNRHSKMIPNPPIKAPQIQLTQSYEGYF